MAVLTLFISNIAFGLEIKGNYFTLFFATIIFLVATLSLGIFISSISDSQQVAFQIASVATMLPTFILSGFIFPIESMPWAVQILTNVTPAKFYIIILRAIILKGVGIEAFWKQLLSLLAFAVFFTTIAALKMRKANS